MEGDCSTKATVGYKSPKHAQIWFLGRSRRTWKNKYKLAKTEQKRLRNGLADVTKSRDAWRAKQETADARLKQLEAESAALAKQVDELKKPRGKNW